MKEFSNGKTFYHQNAFIECSNEINDIHKNANRYSVPKNIKYC